MLSQPVAACEFAFRGNPNCLAPQVCLFCPVRALAALYCSAFCALLNGLFLGFGRHCGKSCRFGKVCGGDHSSQIKRVILRRAQSRLSLNSPEPPVGPMVWCWASAPRKFSAARAHTARKVEMSSTPNFVRISMGTEQENEQLVAGAKTFLAS